MALGIYKFASKDSWIRIFESIRRTRRHYSKLLPLGGFWFLLIDSTSWHELRHRRDMVGQSMWWFASKGTALVFQKLRPSSGLPTSCRRGPQGGSLIFCLLSAVQRLLVDSLMNRLCGHLVLRSCKSLWVKPKTLRDRS